MNKSLAMLAESLNNREIQLIRLLKKRIQKKWDFRSNVHFHQHLR